MKARTAGRLTLAKCPIETPFMSKMMTYLRRENVVIINGNDIQIFCVI